MITVMTKSFIFHIYWISTLRFRNISYFFFSFFIIFLSDITDKSINK
jgi:hypothetical protein